MTEAFNIDCMEAMAQMKDNEFDLAIVDPPYNETFNTGGCIHNKAKKGIYNTNSLNNHLPGDKYWDELIRVSDNQIIWGANWYGKYFGAGGICWFKDNTGNYSPCEFAYQSINNHINHFQYRWNGMLQENMKDKEIRLHPTQKPIALYKWLLKNYAKEGDRILDTHLGSGSSRIAAYDMGFDFVGYEIDKDYFDAQEKRFANHIKQQCLFNPKDMYQ